MSAARGQFFQLNWVRAIAALMVAGYHLEITMALPKYFGAPVFPTFVAGASGVELFFVLSGFVIYYAHHRDRERDAGVLTAFSVKRVRRLYPPLWIVLGLVLLLALASGSAAQLSGYDILASFLILPLERETLLGVEWTLRHEVLFYLLFLAFLWDRRIGLALLVGWGLVGSMVGLGLDEPWWLKFLFSPYHLLFLAGMGIGRAVVRGSLPAALPSLVAGIIAFSATWWLVGAHPTLDPDHAVLLFGGSATAIIYGLVGLPALNRPIPALDLMGAASYSLYLIHYPLLAAMLKVATVLESHVAIPAGLAFAAILIACQGAGVLFHLWVEKPAIRLISAYLPGRSASRPARQN